MLKEKSEILLKMIDDFNDLVEKTPSAKQSLIPLYLLSETNSKEAIMLHEYFGVCHINMTLFSSLMDNYTPSEIRTYLYIQLMTAYLQINAEHDFNRTVLDEDYRNRLIICCSSTASMNLIVSYKGTDLDSKILATHCAHFSKKVECLLDKKIEITHDHIENILMNIIIQFHPKEKRWRMRNKLEKAKNVKLLMTSKDGIERWIFTLKENGRFVDISNVADYHYMISNILMNPSNYALGELID